jgi:DNA-binding NarL/FixJ family response regulator
MPQLNGLAAAAATKLKEIIPAVKMLTRLTDKAYLQEFLQAGIFGRVLKQSAPDELIRAIRILTKRR